MKAIHYTELPPSPPGSAIATEWDTYRREAGRLLKEGHEGKWVLVKGTQIVGMWDSEKEAYQESLKRYLLQPALVHQILEWEPTIRGPIGFFLCRNLPFPWGRTG
jgi:hypothetical protein